MLFQRIKGKYQRTASYLLARRPCRMQNREPLISFTFDDFPRSALHTAGPILERHGIAGTYYTSLGLMGKIEPTGEIFHRSDLPLVLSRGHEFGCHTFAHCHAYNTSGADFEQSILDNREALKKLQPGAEFKTLSYPIGCPNPEVKRRSANYFMGCRAGGQTYNVGTMDLNNMQSFFLEQSIDRPDAIKQLIDENVKANGWLIFSTHDVCENPTRFGCRPDFFEKTVQYAVTSKAKIVPVSTALEIIHKVSQR